MKLALCILMLVACYLIFFGSIFLTSGALPARIATHFDLHGQPNGWMSRTGFINFLLGVGLLLPAFIIAVMTTTGFIPISFVKLPNRDYWLAPGRRSGTSAILFRYALVLAGLLVLFLTGVYELTAQANSVLAGPHLGGARVAALAGLLVLGTVIWAKALKRRCAGPRRYIRPSRRRQLTSTARCGSQFCASAACRSSSAFTARMRSSSVVCNAPA